MAVSTIRHRPDLTRQESQEIFRRHFEGKYRVEAWKGASASRRDFLVIKSALVGVAIRLEQSPDATKFVYAGVAPKLWARLLLSSLLSLLLWNGLTNEVKQFIESAPEFK